MSEETKSVVVVTPEKSPSDDRSYRLLTLENQLRVLLIHDATTDKASAALDVHVGHFSDPKEAPGLAHFLEHMLFLGTEKYPSENEYQQYLNENGGQSNAYTDMENTNYHFDVTHDHLEGALDRFAQFFIAPLFTDTATDREMNAVHNENQKNLLNDQWRMFQLLKSTANPEHPFSKFGTGNLETLRDTPLANGTNVRELLLQFHAKYYSANIMSLVILGRESLDQLQEWAMTMFSGVANKNIERPVFSPDVFVGSSFNKYKIVPVKDLKQLALLWPSEPHRKLYKTKSWSVISHLIGHEGAGSILSSLKAKGWATGLASGVQHGITCSSAFGCTISLTSEGLKHVDEIIEIVYQYVNCLKNGDEKTWRDLFQEVKLVGDSNYRFQSKSSPFSAARTHATSVHKYEPEHVLSGAWLYREFDFKEIQRFVSYLAPNRMRVHVVSQEFKGTTESKEKWYETEYTSEPFDESFLKRLGDLPDNKELHIPAPNPFIPSDFDLKAEPADNDRKTPPTQIATVAQDGISVWWKIDKTFKMPKAVIKIRVISPAAQTSPTTAILTALYTQLLEDSLVEFAYDAEVAGLHYRVASSPLGLSLTIRGYNHKLPTLAEKIFERMKSLVVKPERFAVFKEKLERSYRNYSMEQPYQHSAVVNKQTIQEVAWTVDEKLAVFEDVTVEALIAHIPGLVRSLDVEMLVHGNMTKEDALALGTSFKTQLAYHSVPASQVPTSRVVQLTSGHEYYSRVRVRNPADPNSAITNTFQVGEFSIANEARLEFLAHMTSEMFFNELRTKQQLGYIVHSDGTLVDGVLFWRIIIQSGTYSADLLNERCEAFIQTHAKSLVDMEEKVFESNRSALIARQLEQDKQLNHETSRIWGELYVNRRHFNRNEMMVEELKKLTKADIVAFWNQHVFGPSTRRKVSVRYFGGPHTFIGNDGKVNEGSAAPDEAASSEGKTDATTEQATAQQEETTQEEAPESAPSASEETTQEEAPDSAPSASTIMECVPDRGAFIRKMPLYPHLV